MSTVIFGSISTTPEGWTYEHITIAVSLSPFKDVVLIVRPWEHALSPCTTGAVLGGYRDVPLVLTEQEIEIFLGLTRHGDAPEQPHEPFHAHGRWLIGLGPSSVERRSPTPLDQR
jgi:hypothetical protein